jgi:hypothetical protein
LPFGSDKHRSRISCASIAIHDDLFSICLRAIPNLTLSASRFIMTDGWQTDDLLRPVFMGCATKNVKVITISLGSLQRLIALRAVSLSAIPAIIQTMNDCISQGVDIQLKILQTLLSLITNFPTIHGRLLADVRAFVLCSLFSSLTVRWAYAVK